MLQAGKETKEQRDDARAIHATLLAACKAGTLPCEAEEHTIRPRYTVVHQDPTFVRRNLYGERIYTPPPPPLPQRKATSYKLHPATFTTWLADQGLTPSPLVAAWFKATGTTTSEAAAELAQPLGAPAQPAQTVGQVETTAQRNIRWHLEYEQARLADSRASLAAVARSIGDREGQKPETVRKGLAEGAKLQAKKYQRGEAPPPKASSSVFAFAAAPRRATKRQP